MTKKLAVWMGLSSMVVLAGCGSTPIVITETKPTPKGAVVVYSEGEKADALKKTLVFVNKDFVRIDGRGGEGDFNIYDRHTSTYYQVDSGRKVIDVVRARPVAERPVFDIQVETEESSVLDDGRAQYRAIKVNGNLCREMVTVPDLLPEVVAGLLELDKTLASHYTAKDIATMDVCDQALKVYYPEKLRELGFPAREWKEGGYTRFIEEFSDGMEPPKTLTVMPKGMKLTGDSLK